MTDYISSKHTGSNLCKCRECDCFTADSCLKENHGCCK